MIETVQVPPPVQAPDHPLNPKPLDGFAVSVTDVPWLKLALQRDGQLIPNGALVTVPSPPPVTATVNGNTGTNIAVTVCADVIVTVQPPTPVHEAALHPAKAEPGLATAFKVTDVPELKPEEQVAPQSMPAGVLVTEPEPAPPKATVNVYCGCGENAAVTDCCVEPVVRLQVDVPEQAPVQPANTEPVDAEAESETFVPETKFAVHVGLQLIPGGELVTEPVPVPANVTSNAELLDTKLAPTAWAVFTVTLHAPVPEQAPLHPANVEPVTAVGVNVTTVPLA